MKFIVDAQLPLSLKTWLNRQGHDAIHTRDLPQQNLTEDSYLIHLSVQQQRVIISKDSDFYDYFVLHGIPYKLLMLTTGNIVNSKLIHLFEQNFPQIEKLLGNNKVVEMNNTQITVHF